MDISRGKTLVASEPKPSIIIRDGIQYIYCFGDLPARIRNVHLPARIEAIPSQAQSGAVDLDAFGEFDDLWRYTGVGWLVASNTVRPL